MSAVRDIERNLPGFWVTYLSEEKPPAPEPPEGFSERILGLVGPQAWETAMGQARDVRIDKPVGAPVDVLVFRDLLPWLATSSTFLDILLFRFKEMGGFVRGNINWPDALEEAVAVSVQEVVNGMCTAHHWPGKKYISSESGVVESQNDAVLLGMIIGEHLRFSSHVWYDPRRSKLVSELCGRRFKRQEEKAGGRSLRPPTIPSEMVVDLDLSKFKLSST